MGQSSTIKIGVSSNGGPLKAVRTFPLQMAGPEYGEGANGMQMHALRNETRGENQASWLPVECAFGTNYGVRSQDFSQLKSVQSSLGYDRVSE